MKILLISGHGAGDCGAVGNGYKEADLTREVVNMLATKLKEYMTVDIYNQSRNAYDDVNSGNLQVNFANYDYVFEVHFNAFNGTAKGTEIYVTREEPATEVEEKIMQQLSKYFEIRGVKRKNFNVIAKARKSGTSSALIEVCFIDNAEDMQIYQNNKDGIITAIVNGIVEGFSASKEKQETTQPTKSVNEIVDEVIAGKWGVGEDRKTRLRNAGYNYETIQSAVNSKLKGTTSNKKSLDTIAKEVIEGKWGNGNDRKNKLEKAGYNYNEVQKRVNEILR